MSSVFTTPGARHWLALLDRAAVSPGTPAGSAAAALTVFVGWDARRLAEASEADRDGLADRLRTWAHVLDERGVAALLEMASAEGLTERLLRTTTGERMLTDLRHIGQALHEAAVVDRLGTVALTEWLRTRIAEAEQDYAEERSRRLETDAAAVQVVTIHASKGLEFPVVHVPFAWDRFVERTPSLLRVPRRRRRPAAARRRRRVPGVRRRPDATPRRGVRGGPAARLRRTDPGELAGRRVVGAVDQQRRRAADPTPPRWSRAGERAAGHRQGARRRRGDRRARRRRRAVGGHGRARGRRGPGRRRPVDAAGRASGPSSRSGRFGRRLDPTWRRTSYSGLTAAAHDGSVSSEPEVTGIQDEPDPATTAGALPGTPGSLPTRSAPPGSPPVPVPPTARSRRSPEVSPSRPGAERRATGLPLRPRSRPRIRQPSSAPCGPSRPR